MGTVNITLESAQVTKNLRKDREPTVFRRALAKLSEDKRHPGKMIRVYARIDNDYKVFGVLTINTGGSISFFPDFYHLDNFDHLTLTKDFIRTKGHLTQISPEGRHQKVLKIQAGELPTGDYHLITFAMTDGDLLMDSLPKIQFPELEYDDGQQEEFLSLLEGALNNSPVMLEFPEEAGFYCVQIMVIPKDRNIADVPISTGFEDLLSLSQTLDNVISAKKVELHTPDNFDFSLCITCFRVPQELKTKFAITMGKD